MRHRRTRFDVRLVTTAASEVLPEHPHNIFDTIHVTHITL
jgi:hypothetical protein